ncbi:hypothetical protein [Parasporobacterium paucivorans]|uniref:Uncharacterized protein n=1 Tax=Parasporobacterium paucivorans DSM 15970 TaxID=1122934 RepID=A0A1M6KDB5_9FIRM|nr:hypothetical protein [Parasporobacterium paucivorans]SHJ56944.1 hypothetical protein SAMN02745691_02176 [Parasporobacterium paucivorans DSM 15970]
MQNSNIPIEAISLFSTLGDIRPLRIRLEDNEHRLITLNIDEVVYCRESSLLGINTFQYVCRIHLEGHERLVELLYNVASHKWILQRILA